MNIGSIVFDGYNNSAERKVSCHVVSEPEIHEADRRAILIFAMTPGLRIACNSRSVGVVNFLGRTARLDDFEEYRTS